MHRTGKFLVVVVVFAIVAGALYYFMRPTAATGPAPAFSTFVDSTVSSGGSTVVSTPAVSTPAVSTPVVSTPVGSTVSSGGSTVVSTPAVSTVVSTCPPEILAMSPIHDRGGARSITLPEINGVYDSAEFGTVTIHCGVVSSPSEAFANTFGAAEVTLNGEYTHESFHSPVSATHMYIDIDVPAGEPLGVVGSRLNLWLIGSSGGVQGSVILTWQA